MVTFDFVLSIQSLWQVPRDADPITDVTFYLFAPGSTRRFALNQRYTYRYVATSVTGVTGTTNQTTGLRIEAKCVIEGLERCRNFLRVRILV